MRFTEVVRLTDVVRLTEVVRSTERRLPVDGLRSAVCLSLVSLYAGCSSPPDEPAAGRDRASAQSGSATPVRSVSESSASPTARAVVPLPLGAPAPVHSWSVVRAQAALRLVAANPSFSYRGTAPDVLLAIPVLEVELNGDGTIRRIEVLRRPGQAQDTVQIAIDALHRAAPFGDVSRLPRPWKFVQTFLFNDERKFKPRLLEL